MVSVEIDPGSGFCGGVIRAIGSAEAYLNDNDHLYSLGAIVHNEAELERLAASGLITVSSPSEVPQGDALLVRAHGEPPSTYAAARERGLRVIDCTCPVVLRLQEEIRKAYERVHSGGASGKVLIFGKIGHAEVLGLVGQVGGDAIVIEKREMLEELLPSLDPKAPVEIFSQTTKSPSEYAGICALARSYFENVLVHESICAQVAGRYERLASFAKAHDVILFVAGASSSNGKVLSDLCRSVNPRTWMVAGPDEIDPAWVKDQDRVGICGATSTPRWLLEAVAAYFTR